MKNHEISKRNEGEAAARRDCGFSLLEAVIALAITLIVLGAGLMIIKSMMDSNVSATSVSEVNTDNQTALNIMRRDLQKVGRFGIIPQSGIPLPPGVLGDPDTWEKNRCFDTASNMTNGDCASPGANEMLLLKGSGDDLRGFAPPPPGYVSYVLDIVTPGIVNGHDAVSVVYIDDSARNINAGLAGNALKSSDPKGFSAFRQGDFVYLQNNNILQYVSNVSGDTVTISDGPGTSASSTSSFPEIVHLVRRVTYYMETPPSETSPSWLMRQVNLSELPSRVISGITSFKLTYDILDSSTGTSGVLEVDISPGVSSTWVTENTYSQYSSSTIKIDGLETRDKDFFNEYPYRTLNIVRVNANILGTSETGQGNVNTVKIDQTARIAVLGYPNPGTPPTPPTPPGPDDPCITDPDSCDPCITDPDSCDPCIIDPDSCDPCKLDSTAPGCENVVNAGCALNSSTKGVLCNTPCNVPESVGKPGDKCKVYYYGAEDSGYDCAANWASINWIPVPASGNPHAQNNSEKGYDEGKATEVKNFSPPGYYCIRIQHDSKPGMIYVSQQPFYMK